jgi:hypothetical protein
MAMKPSAASWSATPRIQSDLVDHHNDRGLVAALGIDHPGQHRVTARRNVLHPLAVPRRCVEPGDRIIAGRGQLLGRRIRGDDQLRRDGRHKS